jgi:hypothetical protein
MESVLSLIGKHLKVDPGDVAGLFGAIGSLTADVRSAFDADVQIGQNDIYNDDLNARWRSYQSTLSGSPTEDEYYYLKTGGIIQQGDEVDVCIDGWRDEPKWMQAGLRIGKPAHDPRYPAHSRYRRLITADDSNQSPLDAHDCGDVLLRQIEPWHYKCEGCGADIKWCAVDRSQERVKASIRQITNCQARRTPQTS